MSTYNREMPVPRPVSGDSGRIPDPRKISRFHPDQPSMKGIDLMSFTAQWQRWWPLLAAGFLTALAFVIQPGLLRGTPAVVVALVAVLVAAAGAASTALMVGAQ